MEQGQGDGPQYLEEQAAQQQPHRQGCSPRRQILQDEQPCHLTVLQADEDISAKLPAPPGEHEIHDIADQPPHDGDDNGAHQDGDKRQAAHKGGQGPELLGEHQPVESVDQSGGQDDCDEVDQIVPGLPPGIPQGKLT